METYIRFQKANQVSANSQFGGGRGGGWAASWAGADVGSEASHGHRLQIVNEGRVVEHLMSDKGDSNTICITIVESFS